MSEPHTGSTHAPPFIGPRLAAMMFLQFFIWGGWYVTVGNYMQAVGLGEAIYWAYTVGPIAALVSPFFLGMVADRFFATERTLGVLQLLAGAALIAAPAVVGEDGAGGPAFIGLLLLHMLCYMPTLGLTSSLAFHHMTDQERQFPLIRVFGTVGWIVAGLIVSLWLKADATSLPLRVAGGAAVLMGLYSFTLPHTPPPAAGQRVSVTQALGLEALGSLSSRSFWVFIGSSLLICIPLAAYYTYAPVFVDAVGVESPAFWMSFGQMSEVLFMLVMPLCFARLGVKWMLAVGMLAWVVRYALFAVGAPDAMFWIVFVGILLHGICYDFFFVTGQIYVDKKSSPAIRGQAQGFLVLVTQGVGMLIGAQVAGRFFNAIVTGDAAERLVQYRTFWLIPTAAAGVVLLAFIVLFRDDTPKRQPEFVTDADVAEAATVEAQA